MSFEPIQIIVFILAFVPGYILIETIDYYLLKGEKSQFEKTIQVMLISTFIWLVSYIVPIYPLEHDKQMIISSLRLAVNEPGFYYHIVKVLVNNAYAGAMLFILVCFYSFLIANIWGFIRKIDIVDAIIARITGRTWSQAVSIGFYVENIGRPIITSLNNGKRYIGILINAPDDKADGNIVISDPYLIENGRKEKLLADKIMLGIKDISVIECLPKKYAKKGEKNDGSKHRQ